MVIIPNNYVIIDLMLILKKLFFSLPFLGCFYYFIYEIFPFFINIYLIFSLNQVIFFNLILLILLLILSSFFYILFCTLAEDWKIVSGVALIAAVAPLIFFPAPISYLLAVSFLTLFMSIFALLNQKLKSYITFQPTTLLNPSIKNLSILIILLSSIAFYITAASEIQKNGFQLPDSLIDTALQLAPIEPSTKETTTQIVTESSLPTNISSEQIAQLKQNPELLKQYGLDPSVLDLFDQSKQKTTQTSQTKTTPPNQSLLKTIAKNQINQIIEPYQKYLPLFLTASFFITLQSLFALAAILLSLIVWATFQVLESTGYIHFTKEMREVKKLVV
jgi:hypothetical protein